MDILLDYHRWATLRVLDAAQPLTSDEFGRDLSSSHSGIRGTLVHLCGADAIWLARLRGERPPPFPPEGEVENVAELRARWLPLLDGLEGQTGDPQRAVGYARLDGSSQSGSAGDILRHVVNHGAHHRGQVVTLLRRLGHAAPNTDLIAFYRTLPPE